MQRWNSNAKTSVAPTESERENISTTVTVNWSWPTTHVVENDEAEGSNETRRKTDGRQRLRWLRLRPHVCTSPRADRWTDGCCTSIFFCVIVSSGVFFHAGCGADEAGFPRQRNLENVISIACIVVVTSLVRSGSSTCWTGWLIATFQRAFLETSLNANAKAVLKKNLRESTPRLPF